MSGLNSACVRRIAALALIAHAGAAACTAADSDDESTVESPAGGSAVAAAATDSAPPMAAAAWYDRTRSIDLTGDGQLDTARLTARGTRPDSMQVGLVFIVDGEERHREEWGSSYELEFRDAAALGDAQVEALLRARLDTVLASVAMEPLEGRTPGLLAEDSAILKDISPWPRERVIFSYGFESQPNLFWDAPRGRFVRLWSCC